MNAIKTLSGFALAGAIAGAIAATMLAPGFLAWYNTPGGTAQALCTCQELVRATASGLINAQLVGSAVGATASVVLGVFVVRARRPRAAAPAVTPP